MITKLVCQLPDVDGFGRKGRLRFDPECVQDLGWIPNDWKYRLNPDHVKDIADKAQNMPRQRAHHMQLKSALVNEVQCCVVAMSFYLSKPTNKSVKT